MTDAAANELSKTEEQFDDASEGKGEINSHQEETANTSTAVNKAEFDEPVSAAAEVPLANRTTAVKSDEQNTNPAAAIKEDPTSGDEDDEDLFGENAEDTPSKDVKKEEKPAESVTPKQEVLATPVKHEVSIPRKAGSSNKKFSLPSAMPAPAPTPDGKTPGKKYGLPEGVFVPDSIVRSRLLESEMNTKLMETLKSLPVNLINDALTEYDDAVEIKGANSIRNHGAYLYGVVKRYVSVHERALSGEGTGVLPMGEHGLTPTVEHRLEQLVTSGFCNSQEMNDKVKSKIRMLSEKDALFALDELSSVSRSSIRNFGSYFMGILNRYMRGESSKQRASGGSGQSRGRDRSYRDNNNATSSSSYRERSRDRFGDRRGKSDYSAFRSNNDSKNIINNPMYDNRQQAQPWQQQPNPSGNFSSVQGGPLSQQNRGLMNQQPLMQGMQGMPQNSYPPPQQLQPPYMQQQQPMYSQQQQPFVQQQQPGYSQSDIPQQGMQQNSMYQQQNSMMGGQQPQSNMQQPYSNTLGNQPLQQYMQQQQQPPMLNPHQQPFVQDQQSMRGGPPQQQGGWQQQQQQPPSQQIPVDILGLADKAASAVQALASQNKINPESHQQAYNPQQQQRQGFPLYGGNTMGPSPGMMQQPMQYPPQQQQPYQYQQQGMAGGLYTSNRNTAIPPQQSAGGRKRTTAGMSELPITVQYAVQNLVATGAIDSQPDEGILGMIFDLPEHLALAALQKFAAIDKSTMRNKTAYLAGVLRRELEKINKR